MSKVNKCCRMKINPMSFKSSVSYNRKVELANQEYPSNPMRLKANLSGLVALSNYSQVTVKPKFDYDSVEILTKVDALSKLIPQDMHIPYSFKLSDINGERIYDKENKLLCVREYENERVIDYIPSKTKDEVAQIVERDRISGEVISKIERAKKEDGETKINVTVYDDKINDKYIMFQLDGNSVLSITEFSANGKKFRTLIRDSFNNKPQRYMEAKEDSEGEFIFTDAKLNSAGEVVEIKKVSSEKETCIKYEGIQKIIEVKQKSPLD